MVLIRLATSDDATAIARVHLDSWEVAFRQFLPEYVAHRGDQTQRRMTMWQEFFESPDSFVHVAVERDTVIGFAQGGAARNTMHQLLDDYDGELYRLYITPSAQGQRVGTHLIQAVAQRLHKIGHSNLLVAAYKANLPARSYYEHLGATFVQTNAVEDAGIDTSQTIYVWEDITTLLPKIQIRKALVQDAAAIAEVQVATWRTAYTGIMSAAVLAGMSVEQNTANWERGIMRDTSVCYVATADDVVVGFAYGARCRDEELEEHGFDGEIYALYVLEAYQGVGLGRQLVNTSVQALRANGYTGLAIWVLKDNTPARGFYEKIGGVYVKEKTINVRGEELIEVAYGWQDLSSFLAEE